MGRHKTRVTETVQGPPSSLSELLSGAQRLLDATASRMRTEVQCLDGDLLDEKLLLLQQLDHLDSALMLLGRLLPASPAFDQKLLSPDGLCEASTHLRMAVHTMLALAPKFREATSHRLARQLGSGHSMKFECCSRRAAVELSPQKRKSRMKIHLDKLEKQHETCLLDLLLTFEYLATAESLPTPDTPSRCAEGARYVLAGQAKLHQSHAMLCQLLVEEDDLLFPILEWQLGAAASDFAVARAVLDRLPREPTRRSRRRIDGHAPPTATVGIRCESKARFIQQSLPGKSTVRLENKSLQISPRQGMPHLPRSPAIATIGNEAHEKITECLPQEVPPLVHSCRSIQQRTDLESGCAHNTNDVPLDVQSSGFFPNLGALGPSDRFIPGATAGEDWDSISHRCMCKALECSSRRATYGFLLHRGG
ncbi:hypothetical protein Efla_001129 [Eimeria flavescens]